MDGQGNLYIADKYNQRVRKVSMRHISGGFGRTAIQSGKGLLINRDGVSRVALMTFQSGGVFG